MIAGVEMASMVFKEFDPSLTMMTMISDGTKVEKESIVFEVEGSSQSLLATERLVLNCLQRMSGIAKSNQGFISTDWTYFLSIIGYP